ncbi:MAG: hypothetical protein FJ148_27510 [Deltaproteobacteria bacterium]|nr:hypothetical protein [Deltaproteobacteria bacterium]
MLELDVAPALRDLLPAIGMEFPDEILARDRWHGERYTPGVYPATGPKAQPKAIAGASVAVKANKPASGSPTGLVPLSVEIRSGDLWDF